MVAGAKTSPDAAHADVSRRDACRTCRREFEDKLQTWRRALRRLYLAIFLLGFGVGFYFTFISVSNMSVYRVHLDHGRERDYASRHLYNEHASYGVNVELEKRENEATTTSIFNQFRLRFITEDSASSASQNESPTVTCPCTRTTLSWTDYTHFYFLTYFRPDRKPYIKYLFPSALHGRLGGIEIDNASGIDPQYLTRAPDAPKSANDFCNLLNNLPDDMLIVESQYVDCRDLVGPILSSVFEADAAVESRWKDSIASLYESPVLLHQKFFYSKTLGLLRSYVREKHMLMQSSPTMMGENFTNRNIFLRGLTVFRRQFELVGHGLLQRCSGQDLSGLRSRSAGLIPLPAGRHARRRSDFPRHEHELDRVLQRLRPDLLRRHAHGQQTAPCLHCRSPSRRPRHIPSTSSSSRRLASLGYCPHLLLPSI